MTNFKKVMESSALKERFSNLLQSLDRTNTSKMIIERHYSKVASIELEEGKNNIFTEIKGIKSQHPTQVAFVNEQKSQVADQFLLKRIEILESAIRELKAYSWMNSVNTFIKESEDFLRRNETVILIERVIFDLEMDRNKSYFSKAINQLRECSNSENPVISIVETMSEYKWIPLTKKLYEYASKLKGSITGENPNFRVSKIYSPVISIDENKFVFVSSGKILELDGSSLSESNHQLDDSTKSLVAIAESAKFSEKGMRIYPNTNSVLDLEFGEKLVTKLNGKIVESSEIENHLLVGGFVKIGETSKLSFISQAINEGSKIKEIDFGYRVTSSIFEGLSVNIFNLNDQVYIQKINKGMRENSFILAESAENAIKIVKDFMNYDISNSLTHLLENEKAETSMREKEIGKIESRIKFLIESFANLERVAKLNGLQDSEHIKKARILLEEQIAEQNEALSKFGLIKESNCIPGKEYTIDGNLYVYQGVTDGVHIFNTKEGDEPIEMTDSEYKKARETGKIK